MIVLLARRIQVEARLQRLETLELLNFKRILADCRLGLVVKHFEMLEVLTVLLGVEPVLGVLPLQVFYFFLQIEVFFLQQLEAQIERMVLLGSHSLQRNIIWTSDC